MAEFNLQGFIDSHHRQCVSALQMIAQLADAGSDEHKRRFNPNGEGDGIANGWRVAEAMREIANDAVGNISLANDVRELLIYKQAFDAMASQMIHPKMTGLEMAKMQLGIN